MATMRCFPTLTFTRSLWVPTPEAAIDLSDVEQFCAVVGNHGESFKTARSNMVQAPMDFAIVTCWKVTRFIPCRPFQITKISFHSV
jgi:enoyl reductase-like protein